MILLKTEKLTWKLFRTIHNSLQFDWGLQHTEQLNGALPLIFMSWLSATDFVEIWIAGEWFQKCQVVSHELSTPNQIFVGMKPGLFIYFWKIGIWTFYVHWKQIVASRIQPNPTVLTTCRVCRQHFLEISLKVAPHSRK